VSYNGNRVVHIFYSSRFPSIVLNAFMWLRASVSFFRLTSGFNTSKSCCFHVPQKQLTDWHSLVIVRVITKCIVALVSHFFLSCFETMANCEPILFIKTCILSQCYSTGVLRHFEFKCVSTRLELAQCYERVPEALSPGLKQPGCEADYSPLFSAAVKNSWSYITAPPYVFMVWCSFKHRGHRITILWGLTQNCLSFRRFCCCYS
jgi:hypothetical protein